MTAADKEWSLACAALMIHRIPAFRPLAVRHGLKQRRHRWAEQQCKLIDECLQLHGGYGYMRDYAIGRALVDARAQRIYGGTNEIMKEIISRTN